MEKLLNRGHFILLNGGSSAGKTTLVEQFQNYAFEHHKLLYLTLGIDSAFHIFPKNIFSPYLRDIRKEMMFDLVNQGDDQKPYPVFEHTEKAHQYVAARYKAVGQFLDAGFSVISDEQFWHKPWVESLKDVFQNHVVYLVKVDADENTLLQREANRGDRAENLYISSKDICHRYMQYDLEIDTSNNDVQKNVLNLWEFIQTNQNPSAIKRL
ncbi:chloramphenicol phosphotransferase CPT family protein [Thiotrichales bacterium 19S3-7]|nr:chloramphenicol phosphotransferase CPT family protein [Thiotrichales bacterium 19S3-7]MCF6801326.1 chloramphenicol phosphotransferase CPT family protein [Thiotrichales bacterium 19S3-11]